jgi:multidrug efflux pump subunit AcrA (membrane-fusion protein)
LATAAVARRTLATAANLDGTLAYEGAGNVGAGVAGTVTWLPAEGTVIKRGGVLYELDGTVRPRLLFGSRPLWRPLGPGVTNGADVRQLEQNLKAMGYASRKLRVDYHWDKYTTAAVKRWQKAVHWKADGTLDAGDIAFLPGPVRVASHQATLGAGVGPGAPVVGISTARRVVTLDLAATRQDLVKAGQTVSVTLPGGSTISGKVRRIGRVATPGQNGNPATVPVTIDLGDGTTLPDLDAAPVTVHVTTVEHANVLAVPVNSLVALLEGGYAVETVRPDGSHKYIGVTPGLYQDGYVEVSGSGLAAGDTVVVAR